MSDDTLSQLVADAITRNIAPLVRGLWGTFGVVIVGTTFVVGMVYDVRQGITDAKREAAEAKQAAIKLQDTVIAHDRSIAVLESRNK
jgi:hypothetical protein